MIHLHLDPLGGLSGDMFAAAVLAAFPGLEAAVAEAVRLAAGTECRLVPHQDGVLAGCRFLVLGPDGRPADATPHAHDHLRASDDPHGHGHAPDGSDDRDPGYPHTHQSGGLDDRRLHGREDGHAPGPDDPSDHGSSRKHGPGHKDGPAGTDHGRHHAHDHHGDRTGDDRVPARQLAREGRSAGKADGADHGHHHAHEHHDDPAGDGRVPARDLAHADRHRVDGPRAHVHAHGGGGHDAPVHSHGHRAWSDIRAHLERCGLPDRVRAHAIGIFAALAEAEGRVHGRPAESVTFHEVGNADSIADIVAAAVLIHGSGARSWSVSALPLGGGRVRTAHGSLPVPAPATALLLDGFACVDDGVGGERVTPTGASILRYLKQVGLLVPRPAGRLGAGGIGFGTRRLPGLSNCVRLLRIDTDDAKHGDAAGYGDDAGSRPAHRALAVIGFEVDDQSGEDLAAGLDRVRAVPGVHDVVQMMAVGKKGRIAVHVQVLAAPDALDAVVAACFSETTTIGLRTHLVQGRALARRTAAVEIDGATLSVKLVRRPDGETGKAEADHVLALASHAVRDDRRRRAVSQALRPEGAAS